jgi:hypothetical protein
MLRGANVNIYKDKINFKNILSKHTKKLKKNELQEKENRGIK